HRPAQIWTPQEAVGFWNLTVESAMELARPYVLVAARSSALFDEKPARYTMEKLDALQRHPEVGRMRFVTTVEALDTLVGVA
ncbi:MAG TPA: hypothetical protein VM284_03635, partial [Candidatus Limnocylindria bacterium]|nr:hypothetical protein [Candidatus Limnocylindria bacterium]